MRLPWTRTESRWLDGLLAAVLPGSPATGAPPMSTLELDRFHARLDEVAPPLLRAGLRGSVWALTFAPPVVLGRLRPFHRLSAAERDAFVRAAAGHRLYAVRQLVETLKLIACFAYFHDPDARAHAVPPAPAGEASG